MVTLKVYDLLGKVVSTLVDEFREQGSYSADFNAQHLSSGIYIYELKCNSFRSTKKMMLVK